MTGRRDNTGRREDGMTGRRAVLSSAVLGAAALATIAAVPQQAVQAPTFEVDLMWPRPMQNHWLLGSAVGVAVDSRDHVFVVHLTNSFTARTEIGADANPPIGECCRSAPAVLEFDPEGNVVNSWGGPGAGYTWPTSNHGLAIDPDGNIWIGGSGGNDSHILKFSAAGKFIAQIGKASAPVPVTLPAAVDTTYTGVSGAARGGGRGDSAAAGGRGGRGGGGRGGRGGGGGPPPTPPNSTSTESFGGPAGFSFDAATGEAFVADGYRNRRVAVVDIKTGAIKRFWGASGNAPADAASPPAAQQFGTPVTCAEISRDGLVYVCDRSNNRIQVFDKAGKFIKEATVTPATRGEGSVWDVTFSRDAQQRYLYVADGANMKVHVLDRVTLRELTSFGEGGRLAGQFYAVHSVATDSKGNVYTVETYQGKRLQKFNFKGVQTVTKPMGPAWPGRGQ